MSKRFKSVDCSLIGRGRCAANDGEARTLSPKEILEVFATLIATLKRGTGRDEAELFGLRTKSQPIQQHAEQVGHFCSGRAAIGVQLVYDEMKNVAAVGGKPVARFVEDIRLNAAHQHDVEHRIVSDEQVRWMALHVPA